MDGLKPITHFLDQIDGINWGGCGVSALAIYRWLEKHNNHNNYGFVFLYEDDPTNSEFYYRNQRRLENGKKNLFVPCHICLVHKKTGIFIDSTGIDVRKQWNRRGMVLEHFVNDVQVVVETLNKPWYNEWNSWFNRGENLWRIEEYLEISLRDVSVRFRTCLD